MAFRISFGSASCRGREGEGEPVRTICRRVQEKIESLKALRFEQLGDFREQEPEVLNVSGNEIILTTFKENLEDGRLLVVAQAFFPTLWFPNFISLAGVGKVLSEGFCVKPNGEVQDASEEMLWQFR